MTGRTSRSPRRGRLTAAECRLLEDIAESSKAFGMWTVSPDLVPVDIAMRAAERAYRRGVTQGAYFMLWHLRGTKGYKPHAPGEAFASRLWRWRERGSREEYAKAELPPGHLARLRGDAP